MVGLPPKSENEFKETLNWINLEKSINTINKNTLNCVICHKFFKTKETLNNHLKSKKHI